MKSSPRQLMIAGLLATLGLAASAQTPPPPPAQPQAPMAREAHGRFDFGRMQERMAQRLTAFKQKLQLTPAQEAAWNSYVAALKPTAMARPDRGEFARLSTPERIDRMRAMRTARMAEMDKRGDATKTFYAALSADQKKVFDAETARRGHGGRHGHEGHGPAHRS